MHSFAFIRTSSTLFLAGFIFSNTCLSATTNCVLVRHSPSVISIFQHDKNNFTQGFVYENGLLYESTGLYGRSTLQSYSIDSPTKRIKKRIDDRYFAEGLTVVGDNLIQLTYKEGVGFIYDINSLRRIGSFKYGGEGWGLTYDGENILMSDGSEYIRKIDTSNYSETGKLKVSACRQAVKNINELEYIEGFIFANIWQTNRIVIIDSKTGEVESEIDFSAIANRYIEDKEVGVLNGIAWDPNNRRLFITGKLWPHIYQIDVSKILKN